MSPLIAEDLLLLLLDDETGKVSAWSNHKTLLAGAVLAELAGLGAAEIREDVGFWKQKMVEADESVDVTDPILVDALEQINEKERSAGSLVNRLGRGLDDTLYSRLSDRGVLRREDDKILGLFPRTRWPERDSSHEDAVRADLRRTLIEGQDPDVRTDVRTGVLIGLLLAADQLHKVVETEAMSKKELKKRGEEIADGGWASEAVQKVIRDAYAVAAAAAAAGGAVAAS